MNDATPATKTCKTDGCTAPRGKKKAHCYPHDAEMQRNWRAANPEKVRQYNQANFERNAGKTYLGQGGYIKYVGTNHPAANASGLTNYHRLVLWDKLNGQNVPCAECGGLVRWDVPSTDPAFIVGDHIDENKQNNSPENIDPVHQGCNTKRAARNKAKRMEDQLKKETAEADRV
jgi:hypothetical protein